MLGTWLVLHLTVHYVSNPLGLPAAMCAIPLVFYIALYASGHTLKVCRTIILYFCLYACA